MKNGTHFLKKSHLYVVTVKSMVEISQNFVAFSEYMNLYYHFCPMQKSMKAEMEMAMKLLEKDVHHKQDTIVCLRDQLEDIKDINLEMYTKLSVPTTLCLYCAQWEQRGIIILT